MCTRAVSTLAHVLEQAGLATVALVSNREQALRAHPPRALYADFPLGRPLGRPRDPAFQRRVLAAAFALLEAPATPVLVDFPESIHDRVDEPLSCPLPPRHDPRLPPAVDEALGLRPAWERARARMGGTQVGRVVGPDAIPDALAALVRIAEGVPWTEAGLPGDLPALLMDVRCYYEEAALALSDHVPEARAAESWLYRQTETGALLRTLHAVLARSDPPFPGMYYVLPLSQLPPGEPPPF
jgi:hypothetical protein